MAMVRLFTGADEPSGRRPANCRGAGSRGQGVFVGDTGTRDRRAQ